MIRDGVYRHKQVSGWEATYRNGKGIYTKAPGDGTNKYLGTPHEYPKLLNRNWKFIREVVTDTHADTDW